MSGIFCQRIETLTGEGESALRLASHPAPHSLPPSLRPAALPLLLALVQSGDLTSSQMQAIVFLMIALVKIDLCNFCLEVGLLIHLE